ncbi:MAG: hypothetical protein ACFFG0_50260 [Candidatus Thorarchaeota archaeon]
MKKKLESKKSQRLYLGFIKPNYKKTYPNFKPKVHEIQESTENLIDDLLRDLNPIYFEEGLFIKEAIERINARIGSKFDFFSVS